MLGMEHVVDGGETDILVAAAVPGHEVRVEELAVIELAGIEVAKANLEIAIGEFTDRCCSVRDVVEERVAGTHGKMSHHALGRDTDHAQRRPWQSRGERRWSAGHHNLRKAGRRV